MPVALLTAEPACQQGLQDSRAPQQLPPSRGKQAPAPRPPHQVTLGWAWTDRFTYEAFAAEAAAAPPGLRPALGLLLQLYGLSRIEAGVECYLSTGALSGDAIKAVHGRVNELCRQLGADGGALALALCAGFGIPPHLLQAPIAIGDWRTFQG